MNLINLSGYLFQKRKKIVLSDQHTVGEFEKMTYTR